MNLSRHGREYLELTLTTTPPIAGGWEASFDAGATWAAGEEVADQDDRYRWLLAGDLADPTGAVAVLGEGLHGVVVRATSNPEIVARSSGNVAVT